ncbi:MAG TPA: HXXEE domain-containing protein [Ktedonobacteraceae bacterium]|nr:HXXEE domain-containing protein [Ktedonobacteraceae bacterium]
MPFLFGVLDSQLSLNQVIWAFPLAFLIHDLEEIFTMERFTHENRERFPKFLRNIGAISTTQFIAGVGVLFVLTLLAAYLATKSQHEMDVFTIALMIFLIHVMGHVIFLIYFRRYTPGLITAVVIVLPYSLYAFHRLFSANLVGSESFNISLLVGALLLVPLLLVVRQLGKLLTRPGASSK